ncbi:phage tail protein [Vibrio fluvialis]|nr:phage tail protein [Vibrio fluvialis]
MSLTAIPLQFEKYLQNQISVGNAPDMNEMIFAYLPDLDLSKPIDREQGLPAVTYWVHQQDIDQVGKVGDNALVYSVVIPGSVVAFTFNAIYLRDKNVPNSCGMVVHKVDETKEDGMASTKSLMQQYTGAAQFAGINVDAATWQIDYQARLFGLEEDMRLANLDNYGHTAFVDGFNVTQQADPAKYAISAGVAYVGGLRAVLDEEVIQTVNALPNGMYVDVVRQGTALSKWENIVTISLSEVELGDYVDENGDQHYVAKIADLIADGSVTDSRVKGGLAEHEAAPNPHPQYALGTELETVSQKLSALTPNTFIKAETSAPAFMVSGGQLKTSTALTISVGGVTVTHAANEVISTPVLLVGVDYAIYATADGLVVSNNFTVPDGYTAENSRRIGGFHYGNNEFKDYSFYDLHFRPKCKDPRGMVIDISGSRFWNDIYLLNSTPDALGTSAYNAQIADGSSPCKIPALWGGDGTAQYPNLTQYIAAEVLAAYGKRLPSHDEFEILALGSTPGYAVGADPVTTKFDVNARSKNGSEQVSGHLWQWGKDVWDRGNGSSGYAWYAADTNGEGLVHSAGSQAVGAVRLGAYWDNSGAAGARASNWSAGPWYSGGTVGARGLCDHLLHV